MRSNPRLRSTAFRPSRAERAATASSPDARLPRRVRRVAGPLIAILVALCAVQTQAQFLPFGRNKIAYTPFDWHVLKTEHFDIYYYPEMEELARNGAAYAEQSYKTLEQRFCFTIMHRIPLIFYSSQIHFQQTNVTPGFIPEGVGGFFEFMKGRVVIPSMGTQEQFRHVINHELVHVFMHNKVEQVLRDHNLPMERYPPLWFVEGLAEFYSTRWDSQAEMLLRDAVLNGYFVPVSSIGMISGSFLMYKEGQAALEFMAKEYGPETVVQLIDNLWKSADFNEVIEWTIGKEVREFDRAWMKALRKQYYPLFAAKDRAAEMSGAVATTGFNAKPVFVKTGDSSSVVFVGNNSGYSSLYRVSLRGGGEPELLLQGEKTDEIEAFHVLQSRMSVSRKGLLAFVTKSGERDALHLFDLAETRVTRSIGFPGLVMLTSPSWSPDGARIAFSGTTSGGRTDLYVFDTKTDRLEALFADHFDDRDPAWSPDGRSIAFASDRSSTGANGRHALFVYDVPGGRISAITADSAGYAAPSWSADGRLLLCTSVRDGTPDVCVITDPLAPAAWRRLSRVTNLVTAAFDPVWTDKGDVLFTAFDTYSFQIRMIPDVAGRIDSLQAVLIPAVDTASGWNAPSLRGTSAMAPPKYEREYQLDVAQSQISTDPVYGTMGGAALSVSDVLGNEAYNFLIYNTAQTSSELLSSFNIAISRVSTGQRAPYAYGIFNFSGRRYDLLDPDLYFIERAFGGYVSLAYPLSTFRRLEGTISLSSSDKEALYEVRQRKALLLTNSVSYVKDNALYYITGPIDGNRFNLTLSTTTDIQYSNVNFFSVMADYRRYFRIAQRSAVATRFELLYNSGKEARRYFLGGSWDLRGWPRWSIRGTKRWLTSCELRFPLLDRVGFDFPFGALDFGVLRGAIFADAGNAWDDAYTTTKGSIGAGIRFNLFGILVLRYDVGKRIEENFTRLQDGLFYQFFFGWDF
ncbi:MAG: PD40 domain-containing protein [Ignavibacteria bacterium]|nr:PD40 domain-containing protein [Ignavibacteria bacterium]